MRSTKGGSELVCLRVAVWGALAFVATTAGQAQGTLTQSTELTNAQDRYPFPAANKGDDPFASLQQKIIKEQQEKRNKARQDQLVTDTNKLLKLATELKAEVDKSNKDTLSVTVIKKSEEIEKLARSVKDKMKNPI